MDQGNQSINPTTQHHVIPPVVGRVVLYWPSGRTPHQPCAAQIAFVHSERCVNIGYLNPDGVACSATSVTLKQPGDPDPTHAFAEWMPYQVGQAERTRAAEDRLAAHVAMEREARAESGRDTD